MEFIDDIMPLSIGDEVPADTNLHVFHGGEEKDMTMDDLRGKWSVLFFYPADFTFVCPTELEELAYNYDAFQELGTEIISVSTDTVFVHKAWKDNSPAIGKVKFPMAADPTGTLCRMFGTYIENEGLSLRGTFLIDPDGIVKVFEIHDNAIGRSAKELLRKVKAAQFVREHGDQVCPAGWEPGSDSLTPGMDQVGTI